MPRNAFEAARLAAGLTQDEAAERSGVDRKTIYNLEHCVTHPRLPTVKKVALAYGIPAGVLLDDHRATLADVV